MGIKKLKKIKSTCFYCKYELLDHNKSRYYVKFKGKQKLLCRFCTKNKHKPLQPKYKENDTQCKICKKPVLYKNCISCSICDHFYHGKCLQLNQEDISKIESVCNFFICPPCVKTTFPSHIIEYDNIKLSTKPKAQSKQCFTCSDTVPKEKYPNKFFIYENIRRCVCKECANLGKNIPVRKKNTIEFLDCSICTNQVKYESIFCDICQHWVHPYCNSISKKDLSDLSTISENWHCLKCSLDIYPNYLMTQKLPLSYHKSNKKADIQGEFITHNDCSVCCKKVTGHETLACCTCNHWVHKKCIGYFSNRTEYQNFLKYYSTKEWDCPICTAEMLPFTLLEHEEFFMLLLDMNTKTTYLNKENFQKIFIKLRNVNFFSDVDESHKDPDSNNYLNNIDPDINCPIIDTCNYVLETKNITTKSSKELAMLTFNIRSIKKNFKNFVNLLSNINCKIHIICLTETWLGSLDNIKDYELEGYHSPLYQNRVGNMHGGGVITYVHKDINKHRIVKNLSFVDEFNHCLATEVTINSKTTTFLNIYRSPNHINDLFDNKFDSTIDKAKSKICYVLGDANYNLINLNKHEATRNYYNTLTSASFRPLITKPTRITDSSNTLIDHIWSNDLRNTSTHKSNIIITDITDHLPCVSTVTSPDILIKGYRYITKRLINDENRTKFIEKVSTIRDILSFHTKNKFQTLEQKYDDYFFHLSKVYNDSFPLVTKKVHTKTLSKPWITSEVQELIDKKNIRFSKKHKKNTSKNRKKFKEAKVKMEEAIDIEKDKYYKNLLEGTNENIRQKWNAIRIIINRKKVKQDNCDIPSHVLGNHFATVAEKLANELPKVRPDDIPSTSYKMNVDKAPEQKFIFNPTTDREIYEKILQLDSTKGPGLDNFDIKSLKSIADIISPHLAHLFNQSIKQGIYPDCFKIAKCVPVFKGSQLDSSLPLNYRPISVLPAINKTFERILHNQLTMYLEENKLLPSFQYGYRKQHNTSQAILDFTDYVSKSQLNKEVTIAIFMDLSKAFDTVDKNILKQKLFKLGLDNTSTSLIDSYMSNRRFCLDNMNKTYELKYGVPQGSILGPLLFIMYIYDMEDITKENKVIVYADDTTVLVKGKNLLECKQHCNDILTRFYYYFTLNKLSINPSKTKFMVFKPLVHSSRYKKLLVDTTNAFVNMTDTILEQVKAYKFLGVIITDRLTWDSHKQQIHDKICKTLGILYKCREAMDELEMVRMYKAFIQPYFLYAIEVWGHTVQSSTNILVHLQSKISRIIFNCIRSGDAWKYNNGRILHITELYERVIKKLCLKYHMEP